MHVYMYMCKYVCLYACMYVYMYVCVIPPPYWRIIQENIPVENNCSRNGEGP